MVLAIFYANTINTTRTRNCHPLLISLSLTSPLLFLVNCWITVLFDKLVPIYPLIDYLVDYCIELYQIDKKNPQGENFTHFLLLHRKTHHNSPIVEWNHGRVSQTSLTTCFHPQRDPCSSPLAMSGTSHSLGSCPLLTLER